VTVIHIHSRRPDLHVAHFLFNVDSAELILVHDCDIDPANVNTEELSGVLQVSNSVKLIINKLREYSNIEFLAQSVCPGDSIGYIGNDGHRVRSMAAVLSLQSSGVKIR
jgi:hypothetical protein